MALFELELPQLCPEEAAGSPLWLQITKGFFWRMFLALQWGSEGLGFGFFLLQQCWNIHCAAPRGQTELRELLCCSLEPRLGVWSTLRARAVNP